MRPNGRLISSGRRLERSGHSVGRSYRGGISADRLAASILRYTVECTAIAVASAQTTSNNIFPLRVYILSIPLLAPYLRNSRRRQQQQQRYEDQLFHLNPQYRYCSTVLADDCAFVANAPRKRPFRPIACFRNQLAQNHIYRIERCNNRIRGSSPSIDNRGTWQVQVGRESSKSRSHFQKVAS